MNSGSSSADVHNFYCMAQAAKNAKKNDKALEYYQNLLELMMIQYQEEPDGSTNKKKLLSKLEKYMLEAEQLKVSIAEEKTNQQEAAPPSVFSAFNFFAKSKMKEETPPTSAPIPTPTTVGNSNINSKTGGASNVPIRSSGATVASASGADAGNKASSGGGLQDFHDYTSEMRIKRQQIRNSVKANNANVGVHTVGAIDAGISTTTSTGTGTHMPSSSQQQTAAMQRLHAGHSASSSSSSSSAGRGSAAVLNRASVGRGKVTGTGNHTTDRFDPRLREKALASTTTAAAKKHNEYESQILEEMLDKSPGVQWDDIAGLAFAKQTLQEAVILPNLRPDLFTGLRSPPKGVLLFGPPGTGKTLLAKAVASESDFCFFSISSSSVTSKYLGEGEKLMKALFEMAREKQPSVLFFDEIDALMSARKDNEHEASRRLKTEFMTQVDGATTGAGDRLLIMAATNLPWDIDEAVLRRLVRRIYIPLPDAVTRKALITHLLCKQAKASVSSNGGTSPLLTDRELDRVVKNTQGYSGSDLTALCQEAALGPIREIPPSALRTIKVEDIRSLQEKDFTDAARNIRASVSKENLSQFERWAEQYGVMR